jgi:hypothetical protein
LSNQSIIISELSHIFNHIFNEGNPVKNENLSDFYLWTLLVFCDTIPKEWNHLKVSNKSDEKPVVDNHGLRELPKNNLRILFALLPVFYVVITGT